ncbi:MAG: hypothetical protein ACOC47_04565, partial [Alkalispirochaetaceae bacterium]
MRTSLHNVYPQVMWYAPAESIRGYRYYITDISGAKVLIYTQVFFEVSTSVLVCRRQVPAC